MEGGLLRTTPLHLVLNLSDALESSSKSQAQGPPDHPPCER